MVFEEERFYKVVPKSVQADWEVRLRRKIRHDLEKLAAKFGYTLIDRRES